MSLFGALMGMGDFDDDGFFSETTRQMNNMMNSHFNMMNSFFAPSFGMMGSPFGNRSMIRAPDNFGMGLVPMGFPQMPQMRGLFDGIPETGQMYSQSTVMTMSSGPDGRPQVYQASSSMRQGPGGVKETRKSVADSRTGVKKMQIGHHIGERAHVIEKEKNFVSGEAEEREEFINLEEDEAELFNNEWESRVRQGRIGHLTPGIAPEPHRRSHQLALPSSSSSYSRYKRLHSGTRNQYLALPPSSQSRISQSSETKKKRPHDYDSYPNIRRKNQRKYPVTREPIPLVEEPDDVPPPAPQPRPRSSTTIIEQVD